MKGEYTGMSQEEVAEILLGDYLANVTLYGREDMDFAELDDAENLGFRNTKKFREKLEAFRARYGVA